MYIDNDLEILCEYFFREIFEPTDKRMENFIKSRFIGFNQGNYMARENAEAIYRYNCNTILLTFMDCKDKILYAYKITKFNDDIHKFNYTMVIIENNINDVVLRLDRKKKAEEKTLSLNLDHFFHEQAEYTSKSVNKKLSKKMLSLC